MSRFARELGRRILVFDGAMGTALHAHDLDAARDYCDCENCTDILSKSRPDVVSAIHESFLRVGCDCIETNTFGANPLVLAEFGIADQAYTLNKAAAELARSEADRYSTQSQPRFVAGSMGPGTRLVTLGNTTWEELFASYREQAKALIDGGIDVFTIETCQDLLQAKCAINACLAALEDRSKSWRDIPIMVSITIETTGTMLLGTSIEAAAAALAPYPILSLGLNCATGPVEMSEHIQYLTRTWARDGRFVSVMPNAGLPVVVEGKASFPLGPESFAESMCKFVEHEGVHIVGGCCGTTPAHLAALHCALNRRAMAPGHAGQGSGDRLPPACTSLYSAVEYRQDASFLIIGERCNASGSAKFKRLLESEDWDGIVSLAREQVRDGSHVLDINTDASGRDNARDMREVVRRIAQQVDAPLMLDSTQIRTIEAGLQVAPGKCIINSANFEDGEEKFDDLCALARRYGAALVVGSIDENQEAAMARTSERKLAIAERAFDRATTVHGLSPADIFFDPLVLPVSTGLESDRRSALELIDGVRAISQAFPGSQITCGLSNVSFGLAPAARMVLNSVLLHELLGAGLTSAIVHASKILPRNRIDDGHWAAATDLIHDRRGSHDPLQAFIALFTATREPQQQAPEAATLTIEERLRRHIVDGEKQDLIRTLDQARVIYSPLEIINDHLLDGMKTVGELFGSGRMQLPFVLQSAEVMKAAVSHLERFMEKAAGGAKGTMILATVKGDVHDIGKNLVDIILSNNGYRVINLGIKQPLAAILGALRDHRADAIGMSGLLVKSVGVMEENLKEMRAQGIATPVLLGGAALSRHYCEGTLRPLSLGPCYYGNDAFDGLRIMEHIVGGRSALLDGEIASRREKRVAAERLVAINQTRRTESDSCRGTTTATVADAGPPRDRRASEGPAIKDRSDVSLNAPIPSPPFWGARVVDSVDLTRVLPFINTTALFRGQWQIKKGALSDDAFAELLEREAQPVLRDLSARCGREGILRPAVVYGYFPAASDGDALHVFDPVEAPHLDPRRADPVETFHFPRQRGGRRLCISDFFRSVESGECDVVGMHCVTVGREATTAARKLFEDGNFKQYLYLHGLAVETAEALAELWHQRIRQELGIDGSDSPRIRDLFAQHYQGSRYSFGYPACPEMADQEKLFRLLKPERIGCELTENHQIDPEQSTSAIIVHHKEAKYFNV